MKLRRRSSTGRRRIVFCVHPWAGGRKCSARNVQRNEEHRYPPCILSCRTPTGTKRGAGDETIHVIRLRPQSCERERCRSAGSAASAPRASTPDVRRNAEKESRRPRARRPTEGAERPSPSKGRDSQPAQPRRPTGAAQTRPRRGSHPSADPKARRRRPHRDRQDKSSAVDDVPENGDKSSPRPRPRPAGQVRSDDKTQTREEVCDVERFDHDHDEHAHGSRNRNRKGNASESQQRQLQDPHRYRGRAPGRGSAHGAERGNPAGWRG